LVGPIEPVVFSLTADRSVIRAASELSLRSGSCWKATGRRPFPSRAPPLLKLAVSYEHRRFLLGLLRAYRPARVLTACAELGVFDALGSEVRDAAELARRTGADPAGLTRLLNAAVALGLLEKRPEGYANGPAALACLARETNLDINYLVYVKVGKPGPGGGHLLPPVGPPRPGGPGGGDGRRATPRTSPSRTGFGAFNWAFTTRPERPPPWSPNFWAPLSPGTGRSGS